MLDLSSELLEEILLRVPAKSLALMKLTCKQCKTLIEDPNFVEKHFSRMRGREQQLTVITEASPDANSSSSLSSSSGFKVSCMGIDFNRLKKPCLNIKVFVPRSLVKAVFECDGLLVWVMEHNLLILNPLLRRGTIVPVPPPCCGYDYCNYAYGLGYVTNPRSSNDYKIVKFSCDIVLVNLIHGCTISNLSLGMKFSIKSLMGSSTFQCRACVSEGLLTG